LAWQIYNKKEDQRRGQLLDIVRKLLRLNKQFSADMIKWVDKRCVPLRRYYSFANMLLDLHCDPAILAFEATKRQVTLPKVPQQALQCAYQLYCHEPARGSSIEPEAPGRLLSFGRLYNLDTQERKPGPKVFPKVEPWPKPTQPMCDDVVN